MEKKAAQLGMNPSTASGRLVKDVLFQLLCESGKNLCHQCGKSMSRENFSIEHKTPWLDSKNPKELFFDLGNIAFSHHACNVGAARRKVGFTHGTTGGYDTYGCRCSLCKAAKAERVSKYYTPEKRRETYLRTGK
ncbi:hypothetical protein Arno18_68 [Pectobacterium phage Arno18]|uniref:HNH endonuclease n=1 Tax=Pectobacterium phage Arno18 TaxID=2500578 RepID=A0A678ZK52_9CAUD|nr:hypothetical protein Arno18_68 [Pectobacterium phage Arno18]